MASKFEIIPAIDVIDGKCVRLTQGDYAQKKIYNEDPLEVALEFEGAGIVRLHLVDLDGAKAGKVINWKVLEKIANKTNLIIDFGGGIKAATDIDIVLNSGAKMVTIGSMAVKENDLMKMLITAYGASTFLLGADVKNEQLSIHGWTETTAINVNDFIADYQLAGITQFFCTDIAKDGMLLGPSTELYTKILQQNKGVQLIASGGIRHIQDVEEMQAIGMHGAIIGKAIYEGFINLKSLAKLLA